MLRIVIFDVDGVLTDGRQYTDGKGSMYKSVAYKDLDAIHDLKKSGFMVGVITGENNAFTDYLRNIFQIQFFYNCKDKIRAFKEIIKITGIDASEICYIGDGKYDLPVIELAGLSMCPADAIEEVRKRASITLKTMGGQGCIAEAACIIKKKTEGKNLPQNVHRSNDIIYSIINQQKELLHHILNCDEVIEQISAAVELINNTYMGGHKLLICGNGGSATDAQHMAAELVSRFYLERKAMNAEALVSDISILTAVANDYSFSRVFARQIEAKGVSGDSLIGISTSGKSDNIIQAFKIAKMRGIHTLLLTGEINLISEIMEYTDVSVRVPSIDTPRIQEIHILIIHIICELVERKIAEWNQEEN